MKAPKPEHFLGEEKNTSKDNSGSGKMLSKIKKIDFKNIFVVGAITVIATLIWLYFFESLIHFLPNWIYLVVLFLSTFIVFTFFSKIFEDKDEKKRKVVKWTPILVVFVIVFLPSLDKANFNEEGEILNWVNIENGKRYHRPASEVYEDSKGRYFFDPKTGDTCRLATQRWLQKVKQKKDVNVVNYVSVYDTIVDEIYTSSDVNSKGYIRTDVYGYDLNKLENPEVVIINISGRGNSVVKAKVDRCVKIYASSKLPTARHRYTERVTKNLDLSIPITIKGDCKARVLLLDKKGFRKEIAQK